LVKYNSSGVAQWAQTVTADNHSLFNSVAIASDGSVYAAGQLVGTGTCNFGNGVTATGTTDATFLLVKYNSSGVAQWAQTVTAEGTSDASSNVNGVTVAPDGSVYATGTIGSGIYDFGNGVTVSGVSGSWMNILLVKYDSSGAAQWAQTVTEGEHSKSNSVSVASDGSVYITGHIGNGTFNFGNGVTANAILDGVPEHFFLVKYNSSGVAQWARTATETEVSVTGGCGVTVLSDGSVFVAGYFAGNDTPNFGNNVTVSINYYVINVVLVKYNSSGVAQWAQGVTANISSAFLSVAVAPDSSIYAAGAMMYGTGTCNFGNGVTATAPWEDENILLVKYR
ncbi:MAG: hypothetical protein JW807_01620, partial [Spirochaetes bacterium]|nr:hypothetical protein [Spirochaetota bacterium]